MRGEITRLNLDEIDKHSLGRHSFAMKLLSIQIGKPREVQWAGKTVSTGIFKDPVEGQVFVGKLNLEGDGQADLKVHGGIDKAVYGYGADAYQWWKVKLGRADLSPGAFGENLTFSQLDENAIHIGDVFSLGGCHLQVVQPRQPCFKLGIRFGDMEILKTFLASDRPGIYFRVLKEGFIRAGDELRLIEQEKQAVPLMALYRFYKNRNLDQPTIRKILTIKNLNSSWRKSLQQFLDNSAIS